MRSILCRLATITACILCTILITYLALPESRFSYMAAFIDKERLLKTTPGPRLIFAGGSSAAFGVDSERVQAALGEKYNVVNTGLHGGLGLHMILALVKPYVRPGDVVVVTPEYSLLYGIHHDFTPLNEMLGEYPRAWRYVSVKDDVLEPGVLMLSVQKRVQRLIGVLPQVENPVFTRQGFDAHGDLNSFENLPNRRIDRVPMPSYRPPAERSLRLLNEFYDYCRARNVTVLLSFAPYPKELAHSGMTGAEWTAKLQRLTPIRIVSNPDDYLFPFDAFFDTVYHLNARGRELRTGRLIADLTSAMTPVVASNSTAQRARAIAR